MYKYIITDLLKLEVNTQMYTGKMSYCNDIFTGCWFISSLKTSVGVLRIQMDKQKNFDTDDCDYFPTLFSKG